ncbi:MAG TPA: HEAT repeat domain-containing protein [Pyrinomonadaceae bacterium]|nr:HEAT repeat domain-containing protein [Pyrinomonadaceae bacterium]
MNKKNNYFVRMNRFFINSASLSLSLIFAAAADVFAQMPTPIQPKVQQTEDYTWWYVSLFILLLGLVGAVGWRLNSKKSAKAAAQNKPKDQKGDSWENQLDGDKELEWLRKNQNVINKRGKKQAARKKFPEGMPQPSKVFNGNSGEPAQAVSAAVAAAEHPGANLPLPVFGFQKLKRARPFDALPISNDEALLSAIEQTHEEYEEDEEIRDLAVRILQAFKTRNAVEALSQVALYDLSSPLRSKAVSILGDFDHESVFEALLLASADPTREVRAAAARAFTRLSFDRADAWSRIMEMGMDTGEDGKMRHAARAAIAGGYVDRIYDRLIHRDPKHAYEAVALLALLIRAGETEVIFEKLKTCKDAELQRAILHVIKITDDQSVLNELYALLEEKYLSAELKKEVDETIEAIGLVTA